MANMEGERTGSFVVSHLPLPQFEFQFPYVLPIKGFIRSMGMGKRVVELLSAEISLKVCR